jgi:7-cyano-7-deazaguanine synthase in queuosine biosynthesis
MKASDSKVHVFWTGGVDSTFNLIQLLTTTKDVIQPHYVVRYEDSTGIEINVMIKIRRELVRRYPGMEERFLPTIYVNESLIPIYPEIDEEIEELRKIGKVREQYQILAHYCKAFKLERVDLGLIKENYAPMEESGLFEHFKNSQAFKCFRYPIVHLTKSDFFRIAKEGGWDDILMKTSFCRRPIVKVTPCGVCGPCNDAVNSGITFRFPFKSKLKSWILIPFRRYYRKNYQKQDKTWLFKFIRRRFEGKF